MAITDSSTAPNLPRYSLNRNASQVNEGGTITITLVTSNVDAGTTVPYTITGIASADIGGASLTGNFVTGSVDAVNYTVTADTTTEGTETMTFALDNGEAQTTVAIADTSTTPGSGYTISVSNTYSSAYTMVGTDANGQVQVVIPTITIASGDTLTLNVSAPGHPLYIKTTNSTGTGNQVTGATGQGSSSGAVVWDTTGIAAGTYHYNCQFHGAMHGLIVVT